MQLRRAKKKAADVGSIASDSANALNLLRLPRTLSAPIVPFCSPWESLAVFQPIIKSSRFFRDDESVSCGVEQPKNRVFDGYTAANERMMTTTRFSSFFKSHVGPQNDACACESIAYSNNIQWRSIMMIILICSWRRRRQRCWDPIAGETFPSSSRWLAVRRPRWHCRRGRRLPIWFPLARVLFRPGSFVWCGRCRRTNGLPRLPSRRRWKLDGKSLDFYISFSLYFGRGEKRARDVRTRRSNFLSISRRKVVEAETRIARCSKLIRCALQPLHCATPRQSL